MSKQETAVEWLIDWMKKNECVIGNNLRQAFLQAKVMEKDQIIDAYKQGQYDSEPIRETDAEQYYNQTYGGEE